MEQFKFVKNKESLPSLIGIYAFKQGNSFLYIGKSINIKKRVFDHFKSKIFKDSIYTKKADKIGFIQTNSEIQALIKEAELIKRYKPKYNSVWKDSKNYSFVEITREKYPKIKVTHQKKEDCKYIGPFIDAKALKNTLNILRRIFPFRTCNKLPKKPCLYFQLHQCQAPCIKESKEYKENIRNIEKVFKGKPVLLDLKKQMQTYAQKQEYEKAGRIRNQIFSLEKTLFNAKILAQETGIKELEILLKKKIKRIEGYDVSNIQGKQAVGSMIVFEDGKPNKREYKKFKIRMEEKPNDTGMLKEVLERRFKHKEWKKPELIFIDGGKGQLNASLTKIPKGILVISLAKKTNTLFLKDKSFLLKDIDQQASHLILRIRDESHRFAITYHKALRRKNTLT